MHQQFLRTAQNRHIAFHRTLGKGPGVIFLGGFRSDMTGSKAVYLQDWAERTGRAFVRMDYSGHGASSGEFGDGCIGDWLQDACAVLDQCTGGPQVLVGSSMGGWIALLLARKYPERIVGLVGVAAAPDFTEDSMWGRFSAAEQELLMQTGQIALPSEYSDDPYIISKRLIEDGRKQLVLRDALRLAFPVRLLQGTADMDVSPDVGLRLVNHLQGADAKLTFVKGADHRFSTPECLKLIENSIEEILSLSAAA